METVKKVSRKGCKNFSKEELDFIKRNYKNMNYREMAKILNRNYDGVRKVASKRLGIKLNKKIRSKRIEGNVPWNKNKKFGTYEEIYGLEKANKKRDKMRKFMLGKHKGKKNPMFGKQAWNKGLKHSKKTRKKLSKATTNNWQKNEYREKQLKAIFKGLQLKPNKPEKIIINLIQQNNLNFVYVGDGKKIIGGFCPDFIYKKKIIEFNGRYWHSFPKVIEKDKRKLKTYKKQGYKTLVILEKELKNLNQVLNKIRGFAK